MVITFTFHRHLAFTVYLYCSLFISYFNFDVYYKYVLLAFKFSIFSFCFYFYHSPICNLACEMLQYASTTYCGGFILKIVDFGKSYTQISVFTYWVKVIFGKSEIAIEEPFILRLLMLFICILL